MFWGAQNSLIEMVYLSTHNIGFGLKIGNASLFVL